MDHVSVETAQLEAFAKKELLPPTFVELARQWYWPLVQEIGQQVRDQRIKVLGISGTQGSGKSTLAGLLGYLLQDFFVREKEKLRAVTLSLDDFYLTRSQRQNLAKTVHPLLQTRGVPGTHDIALAQNIITQLLRPEQVRVPRFDKAADDRLPDAEWEVVEGPVDLVIVEGWCLCIPPQTEAQLTQAVNPLESEKDPKGDWRHFVNNALADYQDFFKLIDYLIFLQSPSFSIVKQWRGRQEQKLARATEPGTGKHIMDDKALTTFLQHYQRLTEHGFKTLPTIANIIFTLNEHQQITRRTDRG